MSPSCAGSYGYRASAGPLISTDGSVGGALRFGGHFQLGGRYEERGFWLAQGLVAESEVQAITKRQRIGGGVGIDYSNHGVVDGRLGFRVVGLSGSPSEAQLHVVGTVSKGPSNSKRDPANLLGGEFRVIFPISDDSGLERVNFYFGLSFERHKAWHTDPLRIGK